MVGITHLGIPFDAFQVLQSNVEEKVGRKHVLMLVINGEDIGEVSKQQMAAHIFCLSTRNIYSKLYQG